MHARHEHRTGTRALRRVATTATIAVAALTALAAGPAVGADAAGTARTHAPASWAPELDRKIVPTRVERHGRQLATWYGPGLFGNRTACGQTLTKRTWGIAHRTLPCGTLLHLVHKGRSVNVRVIDRGPFSGATVDLTSRTKSYLRFVSGHVKMTEVKRFRVLPRPNVRVAGTFRS